MGQQGFLHRLDNLPASAAKCRVYFGTVTCLLCHEDHSGTAHVILLLPLIFTR